MDKNESSILTYLNENNKTESKELNQELENLNINNLTQSLNNNANKINFENTEKEIEELDDIDNLGYKKEINNNKQRLDSMDSPIKAQFKFSIDMPNVPKQRLHDYLNDDLLKALDTSPNIPNINTGVESINIKENDNQINNPNSLFGFSLYPPNIDKSDNNNFDILNNINNNIINNESDFNILQNNEKSKIFNNKFDINDNNEIKINNYNRDENLISKINISNPTSYIPIQMRNIDNSKGIKEITKKKDVKNNPKNKYDKKKEGKNKKHFEVRIGDWTCNNCNNLNFSFRNKCNRCGLPKEISIQKTGEFNSQEFYNQNINYQMIGGVNNNLLYGNYININDNQLYKK